MFHTMQEAELVRPFNLGPKGLQSWHWVELSLQLPWFLVTFTIESDDQQVTRHILIAELRDVKDFFRLEDPTLNICSVCLVSPSYMNGTSTYQMGELAAAWIGKESRADMLFVMRNGQQLQFSLSNRTLEEKDMELKPTKSV